MIKTFIPTQGAGAKFFLDSMNLDNFTIGSDFFSSTLLLISDKILIDKSWEFPYNEYDSGTTVTYKVIKYLIDREIVEEIDTNQVLSSNDYHELLASDLKSFIFDFLDFYQLKKCPKFIEKHINEPILLINLIRKGKTPKNLQKIGSSNIEIFLNTVFTFIVSGTICSRLYDPNNFFSKYLSFSGRKKVTNNAKNIDYAVGICSEIVPKIELFVSKYDKPTIPDPPLGAYGYKYLIDSKGNLSFGKMFSKDNKGSTHEVAYPDELSTFGRLERFLQFRESNVAKDLRNLYSQTIEVICSDRMEDDFVFSKNEFHKQWMLARAELKRAFELSGRLEKWTDVLTIPGAIASLIFPLAGFVPIVSWLAGKTTRHKAQKDFVKKYPWFFIAEQFGDLAIKVRENFDKSSGIDKK